MMKIVGFVKFYNEGKNGNLERCLSHLSKFVDEIVCCDDSSTDNSLEIARKYSDHIIKLPNDFEAELEHKQELLELALTLDPDWIIHLDPDEILDKPEKLRELCEYLDKGGYDSAYCHLVNLWLSDKFYRVDQAFNRLWKIPIWKNNGKLKFDTSHGLHKPQHPLGLEKTFHSNIQIIHYGFWKRELIDRKIKTYQELGQKGWALKRLNPDSKAILKPIQLKTNNPKITIGIPAYIDSETSLEYFKDCLNSCVEQTYEGEMEILVVDDGSPKPFGEQVENISKVLNARYVRNQENKGIGFTRNRIIEETKGKILYFLSADDMLLPNSIETVMSLHKEYAFYFSDYQILSRGQVQTYQVPRFGKYEDFVFSAVESARQSKMFCCYNIFAPIELWRENMFDDSYIKNEDLEHFLRCLLVKKVEFIHITQPLFIYRVSPEMWTSRLGMDRIAETNKRTFQKINELLGKEVF